MTTPKIQALSIVAGSLLCVWMLWTYNPLRQQPFTLADMLETRQACRAALVQQTDHRIDEDFGFFQSLGSPSTAVFVRCLPAGVDPVLVFTGKPQR